MTIDRKRDKRNSDSLYRHTLRWLEAHPDITTPTGPPGRAGDYIHHLEELARERPGRNAVFIGRESIIDRVRDGTLDGQIGHDVGEVERLGYPVVGVWEECESARTTPDFEERRGKLRHAARQALEADAVLVMESVPRFVRGRDFDPNRPLETGKPSEADFKRLRELTLGVPLATIVHPDATPEQVRDYESNVRGNGGVTGGHPFDEDRDPGCRRRRREQMMKRMLELDDQGLKSVKIAEQLTKEAKGLYRVSHVTVRSWLKEHGRP